MADRIEAKVKEHGLTPNKLTIEVPEVSVTHDVGNTLENLVHLRVMGFGLSIEDFGIGHCDRAQLEPRGVQQRHHNAPHRYAEFEQSIRRDALCHPALS